MHNFLSYARLILQMQRWEGMNVWPHAIAGPFDCLHKSCGLPHCYCYWSCAGDRSQGFFCLAVWLCKLACFLMFRVLLFPFTGLPSPPHTLSYTVQQYGQDSVKLTVQWQSPQDSGGAPVSYTFTASPGATQVTTTATNTSLSGIPYNVMNSISIVATNCNLRVFPLIDSSFDCRERVSSYEVHYSIRL